MRNNALLALFCLFFNSHSISAEINISGKQWKTYDLPNRFPQTIILSKALKPVYFETGENIDGLDEFTNTPSKSNLDEDDVEAINTIILSKKFNFLIDDFSNSEDKYLLINISISKDIFNCEPCSIQKKYLAKTLMKGVRVLDVNLTH